MTMMLLSKIVEIANRAINIWVGWHFEDRRSPAAHWPAARIQFKLINYLIFSDLENAPEATALAETIWIRFFAADLRCP